MDLHIQLAAQNFEDVKLLYFSVANFLYKLKAVGNKKNEYLPGYYQHINTGFFIYNFSRY